MSKHRKKKKDPTLRQSLQAFFTNVLRCCYTVIYIYGNCSFIGFNFSNLKLCCKRGVVFRFINTLNVKKKNGCKLCFNPKSTITIFFFFFIAGKKFRGQGVKKNYMKK